MRLDLDHLPHDTALLHQLVRDLAARVEQRDSEIEKLRRFGHRRGISKASPD
jgi:hypothetical protein